LLVLVYSLGFVIPFLLLGLFTTQVLNFLNVYKKLLKYTVKAGGILLIIIGIMTFTGWMNGVTKYLSILSPPTVTREEEDLQPEKPEDNHTASEAGNTGDSKENEKPKTKAFDFTLTDQFGNEHTLSDYKGKVVFLNFWSTWCPPCQKEMPNIEEVYKKLDSNQGDVIILGVSNPSSTDYPNNADESKESVIAYLEKNKYTFPTVFDETGEILQNYFVSAFPTTFLIDKEGNFFGYATGIMTKSQIYRAIEQALAATE